MSSVVIRSGLKCLGSYFGTTGEYTGRRSATKVRSTRVPGTETVGDDSKYTGHVTDRVIHVVFNN